MNTSKRVEIYTTGFPRSGNTWLNRLLSDLFSAGMQTKPGEVVDYFGEQPMKDDYIIRKTHWYARQYNGYGHDGEKSHMVLVVRDPRDVAVSVMYYRCVEPQLMSTMKTLFIDRELGIEQPVPVAGYRAFTKEWENTHQDYVRVRYEKLHTHPLLELQRVHYWVTNKNPDEEHVKQVVERQKFKNHAENYEHSMRKGIIGDWRNHFKQRHGEFITDKAGDIMLAQGYIDDIDWWRDLPE